MEFGVNGPSGQSAVKLVSTTLMRWELGNDSAAATTQTLPVRETARSKSRATPCIVPVWWMMRHANNRVWNEFWESNLYDKSLFICCVLPVNGGWSVWSSWSQCSSECDSGVQTRERFCSSPSPQHGGSSCIGPQIQTRDCNSQPCSGAAWHSTALV